MSPRKNEDPIQECIKWEYKGIVKKWVRNNSFSRIIIYVVVVIVVVVVVIEHTWGPPSLGQLIKRRMSPPPKKETQPKAGVDGVNKSSNEIISFWWCDQIRKRFIIIIRLLKRIARQVNNSTERGTQYRIDGSRMDGHRTDFEGLGKGGELRKGKAQLDLTHFYLLSHLLLSTRETENRFLLVHHPVLNEWDHNH